MKYSSLVCQQTTNSSCSHCSKKGNKMPPAGRRYSLIPAGPVCLRGANALLERFTEHWHVRAAVPGAHGVHLTGEGGFGASCRWLFPTCCPEPHQLMETQRGAAARASDLTGRVSNGKKQVFSSRKEGRLFMELSGSTVGQSGRVSSTPSR